MSNIKPQKPEHPGVYVKKKILPEDLSVKEAAERLGVGRQALTSFLNGHASLSLEMAIRLEKAFGEKAKRGKLLNLQKDYDRYHKRDREKEIAVRAYTPDFLKISALNIQAWFEDRIEARFVLSAFLRILVNTTVPIQNLSHCDFPAYDNAERHGWDGEVISEIATPWIPLGKSGWEFGVSSNPKQKANCDYDSRTSSVPSEERNETTFVFITPRNWVGKKDWVKSKNQEGEWKEVKAFDASDLEQWLEQSVPAQCWFGEKIGIEQDNQHIHSLNACWHDWSIVTEPQLNKELFADSVQAYKTNLKKWLELPPEEQIVVEVDSSIEALAFLACIMEEIGQNEFDRCVVVQSLDAYKKVKRVGSDFICIIDSSEAEKAAAGSEKSQHVISIRQKDSSERNPYIILGRPGYETFRKSLVSMGIDNQEVERYVRESGRSRSILRRRLSRNEAVRSPEWAKDNSTTNTLIPFIFAGSWDSEREADQEILCCLSKVNDYNIVDQTFRYILQIKETPLRSNNTRCRVTSKIEALFAAKNSVTKKHLEDFFVTAEIILSEEDPALELPEKKRWAAALYKKTREHSSSLRESICDTLILLSVYADNLFRKNLGINIEKEVNLLIGRLLKPFDSTKWLSQQNDLPRYAEAAPDEFLSIIKEDLGSDDPQILKLMEPVNSGIFGGGYPRTGLLWALETLAWEPKRLAPVFLILAQLSQRNIEDNWANTPINSLKSICRSWMPQTSAEVQDRICGLRLITKRYPEIGWQLCIEQFNPDIHRYGDYNVRPRWRSDATGAGYSVPDKESREFEKEALEIAIAWENHDVKTLGDLVERLHRMGSEYREQVWELIKEWNATKPGDNQKAQLRECIRRHAFTRRANHNHLDNETRTKAKEACELLTPEDLVYRHLWLFEKQWVEESTEDLKQEGFDYKEREKRIASKRTDAIIEIWRKHGINGVKDLLKVSESGYPIGWLLSKNIIKVSDTRELLIELISDRSEEIELNIDQCVEGFLSEKVNQDIQKFDMLVNDLVAIFEKEQNGSNKNIRLLKSAPVGPETWKHVEKLPKESQTEYWSLVNPRWIIDDPTAMKTLLEKLLEVDRPRGAFSVVNLYWEEISSKDIERLLNALATSNNEAHIYQFSEYDLITVFETLNSRPDTVTENLARLEFLFIRSFLFSDYPFPNISKQISEAPIIYMQALALAWKRSDNGEDPPELVGKNIVDKKGQAEAAHALLRNIGRIPGTKEDGTLNRDTLAEWISEVRILCKQHAREAIGDQMIGQLLSRCPEGEDGIWPCKPIRDVIEDIASDELGKGMLIGIYNAGNASFNMATGSEERNLASKCRNWSRQLAFEYHYVAALLEKIACYSDSDANYWATYDEDP